MLRSAFQHRTLPINSMKPVSSYIVTSYYPIQDHDVSERINGRVICCNHSQRRRGLAQEYCAGCSLCLIVLRFAATPYVEGPVH